MKSMNVLNIIENTNPANMSFIITLFKIIFGIKVLYLLKKSCYRKMTIIMKKKVDIE